jgi:hypothetical protein
MAWRAAARRPAPRAMPGCIGLRTYRVLPRRRTTASVRAWVPSSSPRSMRAACRDSRQPVRRACRDASSYTTGNQRAGKHQ